MQFSEIKSGQMCENYIFQCYHISDLNFLCSALTKNIETLWHRTKKVIKMTISPLFFFFTKTGIYLWLWHFLIILLSKFFPNKVLFLWWHSFSTKTHWSFKCTYIVLQASKRSVLCIWNECMIGHNFTFVACDCAPFWKHYYKINFSYVHTWDDQCFTKTCHIVTYESM